MSERPTPLIIQLIRHGRVASHRGDVPITEEGRQEIARQAKALAQRLLPGEEIFILHAAPRRASETAQVLYEVLAQAGSRQGAGLSLRVHAPQRCDALRTPDLYLAGTRVEMVSSATALVEQLPPASGLGAEDVARHPFWQGFWSTPDRIGYWVNLPDPPGEDSRSAARRLWTFARSLADLPRQRPRRYLCVSHSPLLRAFLRHYLFEGADPGEPNYGEAIEIEALSAGTFRVRYRQRQRCLS
ncbi:histidine phosphatase family protein [Thermogemmatispora sp.]|uniref:histidine phosphatase family protein n=1 Tax=Thermogemmatispora sp. TaxID=1968838 RepID=UPI001E021A1D|nr:histidine phosphatase family protein [Thermogemmatispora sp.]MBX5449176.1 histidine phosphatase family protein [Thermogemmatispora sp.]